MHHGRYGAVIEKVSTRARNHCWLYLVETQVKKGSVADVMGHLLPGDEVTDFGENNSDDEQPKVVEWQGRSLQSRSYEEVPYKLGYFDKCFYVDESKRIYRKRF